MTMLHKPPPPGGPPATEPKKRSPCDLYICDGRRQLFSAGVVPLTVNDNINPFGPRPGTAHTFRECVWFSSYLLAIFVYCGVFRRVVGEPSVEGG